MTNTAELEPATSLADRIRVALTESLASADIAAVIADVDVAVAALTAKASEAERATLDPLASANDIAAARATAADAGFELKRLVVAKERLGTSLAMAQAAEQAMRDGEMYEEALKERDALAADLAKIYPKAAQQIADLLARVAKSDAAIAEANKVRGKDRAHLDGAEIVARGALRLGVQRLGETVILPVFPGNESGNIWGRF